MGSSRLPEIYVFFQFAGFYWESVTFCTTLCGMFNVGFFPELTGVCAVLILIPKMPYEKLVLLTKNLIKNICWSFQNINNTQPLKKYATCLQKIAQLIECPVCLEVI